MLGGFHKIKDQMLVSMALYIFRGTDRYSIQYSTRYKMYTSVLLKMDLYPEIYIESC